MEVLLVGISVQQFSRYENNDQLANLWRHRFPGVAVLPHEVVSLPPSLLYTLTKTPKKTDTVGNQSAVSDFYSRDTMEQKKVLVTGSSGRLGRMVVDILIQKGYSCTGTDRVPFEASPCPFVQADLCDREKVLQLMTGMWGVVHVAAVPGPAETVPTGCDQACAKRAQIGLENMDPRDLFDNNIASSYNVFHAATVCKVNRVVFSSSAFAMGWSHNPFTYVPRYLPLDEEHPMLPCESYGLSKLCGEEIASMMARSSSTTFVSLRFTNVIHQEKVSLLPWADPTPESPVTPIMWAYTAADDVVESHVLALESDKIVGHQAFLLAAPNTRYSKPTLELIKEHFGDKVEIRSGLEGNNSIICTRKAQELLGWQPKKLWDL